MGKATATCKPFMNALMHLGVVGRGREARGQVPARRELVECLVMCSGKLEACSELVPRLELTAARGGWGQWHLCPREGRPGQLHGGAGRLQG